MLGAGKRGILAHVFCPERLALKLKNQRDTRRPKKKKQMENTFRWTIQKYNLHNGGVNGENARKGCREGRRGHINRKAE
jgi:hypothetical protein